MVNVQSTLPAMSQKDICPMEEVWKEIQGYEGFYKISNLGNCKRVTHISVFTRNGKTITSLLNEKYLKPRYRQGYIRVLLSKDRISKSYSLHRLVALHFIPNPANKPEINHIDGNKNNNCTDNLEWVFPRENCQHRDKTGLRNAPRGSKSSRAKLNEEQVKQIRLLCDNGRTFSSLLKTFNVSISTISNIYHRKTWTHI